MRSVTYIKVMTSVLSAQDSRLGYAGMWARHADVVQAGGHLLLKPEIYAQLIEHFQSGGPVLPRPLKLPPPGKQLTAEEIAALPKSPPGRPTAPPAMSDWEKKGPEMWAELHTRALAFKGDKAGELKHLDGFYARINCGECRYEAALWVQANPPDLDSAEDYFAWSVNFHNAVNERLGRNKWEMAVAKDRWA